MNMQSIYFFLCCFFILFGQALAKPMVTVIDGDTIHIGQKKYRFSGIDAPEIKQTCKQDNVIILCGALAKDALEKKINNQNVLCKEESMDRYQRIIAECFVGKESLSQYLVKNGYALAYRKYSDQFINDEEYAKENKLGLWSMMFEYPWDYRAKLRSK